jgi:hypothetical protein
MRHFAPKVDCLFRLEAALELLNWEQALRPRSLHHAARQGGANHILDEARGGHLSPELH